MKKLNCFTGCTEKIYTILLESIDKKVCKFSRYTRFCSRHSSNRVRRDFFCLLKIGTLSVKSTKKLWLFCTNYKIYRIKLFYEHSISVFSKGGRYYGDLLYILYLNIAMRAEMNLSILEYWAPLLALLSDWNWYLACVAWHTDSSQ